MSRDKQRQCYVCLDTKPLYYFHKNELSKDGHRNICKLCQHNQQKSWKRHRKTKVYQINKLLAGWQR